MFKLGIKKLLIGLALLGITGYIIGFNKFWDWTGYPQVLGEKIGPVFKEKVIKNLGKVIIEQNIRWPTQEDLISLPQVGLAEKNSEPESEPVDFDQALEDLTEEIKKLPQQQLIRVKEQLIREIFPDCQCTCEVED